MHPLGTSVEAWLDGSAWRCVWLCEDLGERLADEHGHEPDPSRWHVEEGQRRSQVYVVFRWLRADDTEPPESEAIRADSGKDGKTLPLPLALDMTTWQA